MFEGHINVFYSRTRGTLNKKVFFEATGWKFLFSENLKAAIDVKFMWIAY
jgi:hypothetical protein